jgi:hypothetical protein
MYAEKMYVLMSRQQNLPLCMEEKKNIAAGCFLSCKALLHGGLTRGRWCRRLV